MVWLLLMVHLSVRQAQHSAGCPAYEAVCAQYSSTFDVVLEPSASCSLQCQGPNLLSLMWHRPRAEQCLWAVGGSAKRKVALVGKGLTFDSGGYNLKVGGMIEMMKFDKGGACAVLGAAYAISQIQPADTEVSLSRNFLSSKHRHVCTCLAQKLYLQCGCTGPYLPLCPRVLRNLLVKGLFSGQQVALKTGPTYGPTSATPILPRVMLVESHTHYGLTQILC